MQIRFFYFLFVYCILSAVYCPAQTEKSDSLLNLLSTAKHDTTRVNTLTALYTEYQFKDAKKAEEYLEKAMELAKKIKYRGGEAKIHQKYAFLAEDKGDAKAAIISYGRAKKIFEEIGDKKSLSKLLGNLAAVHDEEGDHRIALENYFESLRLFRIEGDSLGVAACNGDIGNSYFRQGDYAKALLYHFNSLRIREVYDDKQGIATTSINIGAVYLRQENYVDALKQYPVALKIYREIGDKKSIAVCLNNMGIAYSYLGNYQEALKNHREALEMRQAIKDKKGIATSLNNIGLVYSAQDNFSEAIKNFFASLRIREAIGNKAGIASCNVNIGELFSKHKQYDEARRYFQKAKEMSEVIGNKEALKIIYLDMAILDSATGNYKGAFEKRKKFILYRDSLDNEESRKKSIQSQMSYEFEKKEAVAIAEHKKELENQGLLAAEQSRKQKVVLAFVIGFLVLVIIFAGFIFRSLRVTRKQKNIIEQQKDLVELQKQEVEQQKIRVDEHQREIIDSINYAKRIQSSQMPTERYIHRNLKRLMGVLILFFSLLPAYSQDAGLDSMIGSLEAAKEDTIRVAILNNLFLYYEYTDVKKAEDCLNKALALAQKSGYKYGLAAVYLHKGFFSEDQGNYPEALKNYSLSLQYHQELGDKNGIASAYNNIAHVYTSMGNYPEALKNALASLKTDEASGNKEGMASSYGNIAVIYAEQKNYAEALKNYDASLKISTSIGDKSGEASCYNNIGNIFYVKGNYEEALKNYFESEKLKKLIDDKRGLGSTYNNIGSVLCYQAERETDKEQRRIKLEEGLKYCQLSLEIREGIGNVAGVASSHSNLGMALTKLGRYAESEKHLRKAIEISKEIGYKENLKETYKELMILDSVRGDYKSAYENHKMYVLYGDSLDNEDTRRRTIQNQMSYDFEKKEAVAEAEHKIELQNQEQLAEEKSRKQNIVLFFILGSLFLVLIFAGFIFRSLRVTRKQKNIIEQQKDLVEQQKQEVELQKMLVEEHQKNIIDSITYARRIQRSLLPTEKYIERNLKRLNLIDSKQ